MSAPKTVTGRDHVEQTLELVLILPHSHALAVNLYAPKLNTVMCEENNENTTDRLIAPAEAAQWAVKI